MARWLVFAEAGTAHVVPDADLIAHTDEDCACGPRTEAVKRTDGSMGWIHVHHSLDGREKQERAA